MKTLTDQKHFSLYILLLSIVFFQSIFLSLLNQYNVYGDMNDIVIDNFENSYNISDSWLTRKASKEELLKIYSIVSEKDNNYLHAVSKKTSIQIAKKVKWKLDSYPILTWRWRVLQLPKGANENMKSKNDSAAGIYVIFKRTDIPFLSWKYQPINVIKYVWSSSLSKGKIIKKKKEKFGSIIYEGRFLILETGEELLGKWVTEKRNVLQDYKDLFGEFPKYDPILIGILTDSNNTKSSAISDYDDMIIKKLSKE